MRSRTESYPSAAAAIAALRPVEPIYCIYPHVVKQVAGRFLEGFPGTVLYAVKANDEPRVLRLLRESGVWNFDTASLPEIELVRRTIPDGRCYYMAPARLRGTARLAYSDHGVRDFVVDYDAELDSLLCELPGRDVTLYVRLAAHSEDATYDLSTKYGTTTGEAIRLLSAVEDSGATPALSFNVGSLVLNPAAYGSALDRCRQVLELSGVRVAAVDVGGGFPSPYPKLDAPSPEEFFAAIAAARTRLNLPDYVEILGEPGRALVAEGISLIAQVILRKGDALYLNDGIYGNLYEPVISHGLVSFPSRVFRDGEREILEASRPFTIFGPTCDSLDVLPEPFTLPADIQTGDWIEFGLMGAYTASMRTRFNGLYPDTWIEISDTAALPPGVSLGNADENRQIPYANFSDSQNDKPKEP